MTWLEWQDHWLSRFRWYRRWRGGRWERWWIDTPVASAMWWRNPDWGCLGRPGLGWGPPEVEVYD